MKLPLFDQTIMQFMGSKSNWSGVAAIALGAWMLNNGEMETSMMMITYGMGILGLKDAISKKK